MSRWLTVIVASSTISAGIMALAPVDGPAIVFATAAAADTALPGLRVGDIKVVEGDQGSAVVKVPIDLSTAAQTDVSVNYQIHPADSTADSSDALMKSGTLKFRAGVTNKAVNVKVVGDPTVEADQLVAVTLSAPSFGVAIDDGEGVVDIVDDDANGVNPGMDASIGSASVQEANGGTHTEFVPVTLSRPATTTVTMAYAVACSTASFVTDVRAPKLGKIVFQRGQQSKSIAFKIKADTIGEPNESQTRTLTVSTPNVTLTDGESDTTIVDDDVEDPPTYGVFDDCGHGLPGFAPESVPTGSYGAGAVGDVEAINVASDGTPAHYPDYQAGGTPQESRWASTNSDGSVVVFESQADNLVPGDTNGIGDIFVRDRRAGTTERVSVKSDGSQIMPSDMFQLAGWPSINVGSHPAISADGRYVVFETPASLVPADSGLGPISNQGGWARFDVYLYDRSTHTVELVSATPAGADGGGARFDPSVSAHGRYVTFTVLADSSALGPFGSNQPYVFVRDRLLHTTTPLLDHSSRQSVISADGGTVVVDDQQNLNAPSLLAIDLATGNTDRIDITTAGANAVESQFAQLVFTPSVSSDGRYVAFKSFAWNLIPGRTGPLTWYPGAFPIDLLNTYVRDRVARTTTIVPNSQGSMFDWAPSIDDGAHHVAHTDDQTVRNLDDGTSTSFGVAGTNSRMESNRSLSADGRYLVYIAEVWPRTDIYIQRVS